MIDKELLDILCCPETKQDVFLINDELINKINNLISEKKIKMRNGELAEGEINGGFIREDKKYIYPIKEDIPIMLIDEAFPTEGIIDSEKNIKELIKTLE
jgi:uncharacterized protein YbaR (Trm112 family)